jgi:hypothetical protein
MSVTTTSKVVAQTHTVDERAILRKWCDEAAAAGGSFSINAVYDTQYGHCITYVINWPDSGVAPLGAIGRDG